MTTTKFHIEVRDILYFYTIVIAVAVVTVVVIVFPAVYAGASG